MNWKVIVWMGMAALNVGLATYWIAHQDIWMFGMATFTIGISMFNVVTCWEEPK